MRPFVLFTFIVLLSCACSSEQMQGLLSDGDCENTESSDSDLNSGDIDPVDGDTEFEIDDKADGDAEKVEAGDEADTDCDKQIDGDKENSEGENVSDADTETDGDSDAENEEVEPDAEAETEPEIEPEPLCNAESNPTDFWTAEAEPKFSVNSWTIEGEIEAECQTDGYLVAGAAGMQVTVTLNPLGIDNPLLGRLTINDAASASGRRAGTRYFDESDQFPMNGTQTTLILPYSGEYLITVSGKDYRYYGEYELSAACTANCGTRFTRFPIVLMHGMGGFDSALFNLLTYFNGVEEDLDNMGYDVDATVVPSFQSSEVRAAMVEEQLMEILTNIGARKLNLVAHSQGGLDARQFISSMHHGDDVAVLAMVATPNKGSVVGDIIIGNVPGIGQDILAGLVDFMFNLFGASSENDLKAALYFISTDYMNNIFNPANPDDPRVRYWSWAGVSCGMFDSSCRASHADERVSTFLALSYSLILNGDPAEGHGPNDGMVEQNSATYGEFQGIINADHADEIGQVATYSDDFHHLTLYRNIAKKLSDENY